MNTLIQYSKLLFGTNSVADREQCLAHLHNKKYSRVIDVGGSANSWALEYCTHFFDIVESKHLDNKIQFIGNMTLVDDWNIILEDVAKNGKFDFAICTHTLEDVCNPNLVCNMISKIAKKGFVSVPSKFYEFTRHEGPWRGWHHHRWIYDFKDKEIIVYPKLSFIDYIDKFNILEQKLNPSINGELQWFWQNELKINIVNNDWMGPSLSSVIEYYCGLLNNC
jgi:hypothetical protein